MKDIGCQYPTERIIITITAMIVMLEGVAKVFLCLDFSSFRSLLPIVSGNFLAALVLNLGSYRSNLYFGMKTRTPNSPVFGLMWLTQFDNQMPAPVRHWCDQGDGLLKYGWLKHDGVNFGIQEIEEKTYKLRTEFVKRVGCAEHVYW
jgi:hypothetical protein